MSKRTDRLFHVAVTLFAIALTGASATALVYQHHPRVIESFLHLKGEIVQQTSTLMNGDESTRPKHQRLAAESGDAVKRDQTSGHSKLSSDAAKRNEGDAAIGDPQSGNRVTTPVPATDAITKTQTKIQVHAFGNLAAQSEVQTVKQSIEKYNILSHVRDQLGLPLLRNAEIYLVQNTSGYKQALAWQGMSFNQAQQFSHDTGGFTKENVIIIPLYQNKTQPDLMNTVAHELTHVILNENTPNVPSWLNEGLAVYNGMSIQRSVEDPVLYAGYARRMAESIITASVTNALVPLTGDESVVLQGAATYDLELQDWLAVTELMKEKGKASFSEYFADLQQGEPTNTAFARAFGISEQEFNRIFTDKLKSAGAAVDGGVRLTFEIAPGFQGHLRVLQHDSHLWRSVPLQSGEQTLFVEANGRILGTDSRVEEIPDSGNPDMSTLYVNVQMEKAARFEGQSVVDCGFAIDYHRGLYGFVNTWITLANGKTVYGHDTSLFGITLKDLSERTLVISSGGLNPVDHEAMTANPVLGWLGASEPAG